MTILATEDSRQSAGTLSLGTTTRTVSVSTTDLDATVTAGAGSFSAADVGATISGDGIPAGTTIASVTSDTEIEMSAPATATGAAVNASITTRNQFEKQAFSCELNPAIEAKGDELTMLNGNVLGADEQVKWTLKIGAVQDFMDPEGFLEFCRTHALERVEFEWVPNDSVDSPTLSGDLTIRPGKYGGATKIRLTSEIEFPVLGDPTVVHPA